MSPQTKCGGRGAVVNGTPPHLYLGAGHTSWGAMLHLRSTLSEGTGGGYLPPTEHICSTDKRQVVSPLLMRAGGSVSHTNKHGQSWAVLNNILWVVHTPVKSTEQKPQFTALPPHPMLFRAT